MHVNGAIRATDICDENGANCQDLSAGWGAVNSVAASTGSAGSPSISFAGDSNTGFYSGAADTISVTAGASNVFNISSAGIVSPTTGGALVSSANGTVGAPTYSFSGDPDTGWWRPAADTMAASTAGAERMRIDSTGNVGIGTTTPTVPLELNRSAPGTVSSAGTTVTGSSTTFLSTFKVGDSIYSYGQIRTIATIASDTSMTTSVAFSPALANLGYLRTQAKISGVLELETSGVGASGGSAIGQDALILKNTYTPQAWNTGAAIRFEGANGFAGRIASSFDGGGSNYNLNFATSSAPTALKLSFDGRALFGTATGTASHDIQTAANPSGGIAYGTRMQQTLTASANNDVLNAVFINPTFTNGAFTGVANNGLIVASGNVGIGTTTPRTSLDVNGAIASKPAVNVGAATVDFASNNIAYTAQNCQAFVLHNMKDGATYTFAAQGTAVATCSFTAFSGAGVGPLTVRLPPGHGATTNLQQTLYSFVVAGSTVYVAWIPGY